MPRYIGKICDRHPHLRGERRNGNCPACQRERVRPTPSREVQTRKVRKWRAGNRDRYLAGAKARSALRRERKAATTTLAVKREFAILSRKAKRLGMVVDHIVPLAPCRTCGARGDHVPHNWQVLTARENSAKGNRCSRCWSTISFKP